MGSATSYHFLAEALAQAIVDNFAFGGDESNDALPLKGLASKDYARDQASRILPDRARERIEPGETWRFGGGAAHRAMPFEGTTQICVLDRAGNAASLITSIDSPFGSMVLVPETGILLGNGLQLFHEFPDSLNPMVPGRMPLYGAPVMVALRDGLACGAFAGAGGYRIATGILNTFVNLVDHGLPLVEAIGAPRVHAQGDGIELDRSVGSATRAAMAAMGHRARVPDAGPLAWPFRRTSVVWRDPNGDLHAASGSNCGATADW